MQSINLPFWLAALCAAFPLVFIQLFVERTSAASAEGITPQWTPSVLFARPRLAVVLPFSGLLASFVGGSFASCISQYVLAAGTSDFAEKKWSR